MNRRSGNRRLTRYPAELSSSSVAAAVSQQHLPLRDKQSRRLSFSARRSIELDNNSSFSNSSTSRHHLSVRQRDSSGSSSASRRHHRHHDPSNQTQEEIKFARLMAVLCIFYVLCWIPQLVRSHLLHLHTNIDSIPIFGCGSSNVPDIQMGPIKTFVSIVTCRTYRGDERAGVISS
jgi:hypothetical protein